MPVNSTATTTKTSTNTKTIGEADIISTSTMKARKWMKFPWKLMIPRKKINPHLISISKVPFLKKWSYWVLKEISNTKDKPSEKIDSKVRKVPKSQGRAKWLLNPKPKNTPNSQVRKRKRTIKISKNKNPKLKSKKTPSTPKATIC